MAYNKHTWETNELITDDKLNNIEDGIDAATNTADNAAPKTLTINGKALSANITLDAADVGAVPTTRKINNKALSADVTLTTSDLSAVAKGGDTMEGRLYAPGYTTTATNGYPNVYFQNSGATTGFVANEASTRRFMFNEYPSDSSTYYESFMIPAPSQGLTQNNFYSILTTKSLVTVAQGGTGANTATAALTNLGAVPTSRTITINGVTKALSDDVSFTIDSGGDISGDYLPLSGGTLSGDLKLNSTNAHLRVGSTDGSAGVSIYRSSEGGNINIKSPNGTTWEMDAYGDTFFRIYYDQGSPSWLFKNEGSIQVQGAKATYLKLKSNMADLTSSTNNVTGDTLYPALIWLDKNEVTTCRLENILSADGSNAFYIYIRNYNSSTSGDSGPKGLKYTLSNTNVGTWSISDAAAFRTALGLGSNATSSTAYLPLTGGTISSTLTVNGLLTMNNDIVFNDVGTGTRQLKFVAGGNDYGRVAVGATASNAGWLEIATADDANEPIYVRQYSGNYTTVSRTLTLLDASGNTSIPGYLALGNALNLAYGGTGATTAAGARTNLGLGDMATQSTANYWAVSASRTANTVLAAPNGSAGSASFRKLVAADIPALSYLSIDGGTLNGTVRFKSAISVTALNTAASGDFITVRDSNNTAFGYIKGATSNNVLRMALGIYNTSSVFSEFSICLNSSNVPYCTIAGYEMWSKRTMYYSSSVPSASTGSNGDVCFVPA